MRDHYILGWFPLAYQNNDIFFSFFLQRNYRYFFLFVATSTFLCIIVFIFSWVNVYYERGDDGGSIWKALRKETYSFVLIIYTFIVVWFVGGLTVFHLYLISTNQVNLLPSLSIPETCYSYWFSYTGIQ
jgi:hypothetical protein